MELSTILSVFRGLYAVKGILFLLYSKDGYNDVFLWFLLKIF